MKILLAVGVVCGGLLTSLRPALSQTWVQTSAPVTNWQSVASSADGTRLVGVVAALLYQTNVAGPIYVSTNSGETWAQTSAPDGFWNSVASSADGTKLVATTALDGIYVSTNSGSTWTLTTAPTHQFAWTSVASSADGNKLVAAGDKIYVSTNAGDSWTLTSAPSDFSVLWTRVASSSDGCKLAVIGSSVYSNGTSVYLSTNSGDTWNDVNQISGSLSSIACSADAGKLIATGRGGTYISTDSGDNWTHAVLGPGPVIVSADGSKMFVGLKGIHNNLIDIPNRVYISVDAGQTWTTGSAPTETNYWFLAAASADGNKLIAVSDGYIYIWQATPQPLLNFRTSNDAFTISWIVLSTNLVLQQNSDLASTNWIDVMNTPTINFSNLQYEVILPLASGNNFYRLASP